MLYQIVTISHESLRSFIFVILALLYHRVTLVNQDLKLRTVFTVTRLSHYLILGYFSALSGYIILLYRRLSLLYYTSSLLLPKDAFCVMGNMPREFRCPPFLAWLRRCHLKLLFLYPRNQRRSSPHPSQLKKAWSELLSIQAVSYTHLNLCIFRSLSL